VDQKTKELAAIAASVAGHCQPCLRYHLAKAREIGVPEEDIENVIKLAKVISENGDLRMMEYAEVLMMKEGEVPRPREDKRLSSVKGG
jgi:AhpD family alkylhydroperoxidase